MGGGGGRGGGQRTTTANTKYKNHSDHVNASVVRIPEIEILYSFF
jgi:hypothetical protein